MFRYKILSTPNFNVEKKIIDNIFKTISNNINIEQSGTVNIVFLDDDSIKNLNNIYRNIDSSTDVLSFHYYEDFSALKKEDIAGEIIMSENKIKNQGVEYGLGEEKEFYKLLIHSILHLLGYDHEEENDYEVMQGLENEIWQSIFGK